VALLIPRRSPGWPGLTKTGIPTDAPQPASSFRFGLQLSGPETAARGPGVIRRRRRRPSSPCLVSMPTAEPSTPSPRTATWHQLEQPWIVPSSPLGHAARKPDFHIQRFPRGALEANPLRSRRGSAAGGRSTPWAQPPLGKGGRHPMAPLVDVN